MQPAMLANGKVLSKLLTSTSGSLHLSGAEPTFFGVFAYRKHQLLEFPTVLTCMYA